MILPERSTTCGSTCRQAVGDGDGGALAHSSMPSCTAFGKVDAGGRLGSIRARLAAEATRLYPDGWQSHIGELRPVLGLGLANPQGGGAVASAHRPRRGDQLRRVVIENQFGRSCPPPPWNRNGLTYLSTEKSRSWKREGRSGQLADPRLRMSRSVEPGSRRGRLENAPPAWRCSSRNAMATSGQDLGWSRCESVEYAFDRSGSARGAAPCPVTAGTGVDPSCTTCAGVEQGERPVRQAELEPFRMNRGGLAKTQIQADGQRPVRRWQAVMKRASPRRSADLTPGERCPASNGCELGTHVVVANRGEPSARSPRELVTNAEAGTTDGHGGDSLIVSCSLTATSATEIDRAFAAAGLKDPRMARAGDREAAERWAITRLYGRHEL